MIDSKRINTSTPCDEYTDDNGSHEEFLLSSSDSNRNTSKRKSENRMKTSNLNSISPKKRKKIILKGLIDLSEELLGEENKHEIHEGSRFSEKNCKDSAISKNTETNTKKELRRTLKIKRVQRRTTNVSEEKSEEIKSSNSSIDQVVPTSGRSEWDLMSSDNSAAIYPSFHKKKKYFANKRNQQKKYTKKKYL